MSWDCFLNSKDGKNQARSQGGGGPRVPVTPPFVCFF